MLVNYGGSVRCSLMKGTMNALLSKIFLSGTAAREHICLVWYRGFPQNILKIYVEYFLSNLKVLWIRACVQVHIVDTEKTTTV